MTDEKGNLGHNQLLARMGEVEDRIASIELLAKKRQPIFEKIEAIEQRVEEIPARIATLEERLLEHERELTRVHKELSSTLSHFNTWMAKQDKEREIRQAVVDARDQRDKEISEQRTAHEEATRKSVLFWMRAGVILLGAFMIVTGAAGADTLSSVVKLLGG